MCRCGDDRHSLFSGEAGDYAPQFCYVLSGLLNVRQTPVPTSIIDWIISGLIFSPSRSFPSSSISETCDFSSRVYGVNDLKFFLDAESELVEHNNVRADRVLLSMFAVFILDVPESHTNAMTWVRVNDGPAYMHRRSPRLSVINTGVPISSGAVVVM